MTNLALGSDKLFCIAAISFLLSQASASRILPKVNTDNGRVRAIV